VPPFLLNYPDPPLWAAERLMVRKSFFSFDIDGFHHFPRVLYFADSGDGYPPLSTDFWLRKRFPPVSTTLSGVFENFGIWPGLPVIPKILSVRVIFLIMIWAVLVFGVPVPLVFPGHHTPPPWQYTPSL